MISYSPRRPMRWNAAIGAIARCKATSIASARKRKSVRVLRWICGVKPKLKAVNKPSPHSIRPGLDKPGDFTTVSLKVCLCVDFLDRLLDHSSVELLKLRVHRFRNAHQFPQSFQWYKWRLAVVVNLIQEVQT